MQVFFFFFLCTTKAYWLNSFQASPAHVALTQPSLPFFTLETQRFNQNNSHTDREDHSRRRMDGWKDGRMGGWVDGWMGCSSSGGGDEGAKKKKKKTKGRAGTNRKQTE